MVDAGIFLRDLERLELPIFTVKAHESIVNSIHSSHAAGNQTGRPEIVTGSRDGLPSILNCYD